MEINRSKLVVTSRGGSRSIVNHVLQMTNPDNQQAPTPFEVYHKLHYNEKKAGWLSDHARVQYDNLLSHKAEAVSKLAEEGKVITDAMERDIEKEAISTVCAREKTVKSAWEVGVGPVFRKKDMWMLSYSNDEFQAEDQVVALKEELKDNKQKLKESNDKYERILKFMSSKFPDFENVMAASGTSDNNNEDAI